MPNTTFPVNGKTRVPIQNWSKPVWW